MKINLTMPQDCSEVEARNMIPVTQHKGQKPPPDEVWLTIMGHMDPWDIMALTRVNLRLLRVGRDRLLWKEIIKKTLKQCGTEVDTSPKPEETPSEADSRISNISLEQALWIKIYHKYMHLFGKAYRCPDPGGREGVTYALTAIPCDEGAHFWRCEPRDSFIQYRQWRSTYTPFIKVTLNKEKKVVLELVDTIFNTTVVELKQIRCKTQSLSNTNTVSWECRLCMKG